MQLQMNLTPKLPDSMYDYGERASGDTHGVVLTKRHVVDLILSLAGYTTDRPLTRLRLLEPACGTGVFLVAALERLLAVASRDGVAVSSLGDAITAFDIDADHVEETRRALHRVLNAHGVDSRTASRLSTRWVRQGDFLLADVGPVDVVVGNPPYIRIEQLAPALQAEYRRRYASLFDRADLYVAFIERGLDLLKPQGVLSFICADRWILNRYGAPLRRKITERFSMRAFIDLHKASPFESEVIAYPSIFVISTGRTEDVSVGSMTEATRQECKLLQEAICANKELTKRGAVQVRRSGKWFSGDEPWILTSPRHLDLLRKLESQFEPIESDGQTRVRIGVATGSDRVYIVDGSVNIEPDRLVPLVMRNDIEAGKIKNAGRFVINTFGADGRVVKLTDYPKLAKYLEEHSANLKRRHVAETHPNSWFRTIDRVYPELVNVPKLLIPDIAGSNEVVYERGCFHPHHNLYFVTSTRWDLEVLGGILSSKMALFFVWSYAVKMRGGYLRFQAQYLRRIRVPDPGLIPAALQKSIKEAFRSRDFQALDQLSAKAYGLKSPPEFEFVDTRS
jgi:adenine-specific DNA-methyltransferase